MDTAENIQQQAFRRVLAKLKSYQTPSTVTMEMGSPEITSRTHPSGAKTEYSDLDTMFLKNAGDPAYKALEEQFGYSTSASPDNKVKLSIGPPEFTHRTRSVPFEEWSKKPDAELSPEMLAVKRRELNPTFLDRLKALFE